MFLINDDQSKSFKRSKKRRAGTDHNVDLPGFCTFILVVTFSLGKTRVHNRNTVTKTVVKTHHCLIGQCNLRNQYNCLSARCKNMCNQFHVHFCLAASGHTFQKICFRMSTVHILCDLIHDLLLIFVERQMIPFLCQMLHRIPVTGCCLNLQNLLFLQIADRSCRHIQFLCDHSIINFFLCDQFPQQTGFRFIMFTLKQGKFLLCLRLIEKQLYGFMLYMSGLFFDWKNRFQCLIHC